jgi:dihydrofolate reductase
VVAEGPPPRVRVEGYAIVSIDGMIADCKRHMPDALRLDADQRFFEASLDAADAVAHGRNSHELQPHSEGRRRLILTRKVASIGPEPSNPMAILWNPAGCSLAEACRAIGLIEGILAVIGGTDVFGEFLRIGYDAFHLSRAGQVHLPGGRPLFPPGCGPTPEGVLAHHGLIPVREQVLEPAAQLNLVTWRRLRPRADAS